MATPRVFVSHSHSDNEYCREFVSALRQLLGDDDAVWYDEHNLGWGALRQVIDRELQQREHFIGILSPAAIASEWVNIEIDAALSLLRKGSMQTIQFVVAAPCNVPPTLERYKRIEKAGGLPFSPEKASRKAHRVIEEVSNKIPLLQQPQKEATNLPVLSVGATLPAIDRSTAQVAPMDAPEWLNSFLSPQKSWNIVIPCIEVELPTFLLDNTQEQEARDFTRDVARHFNRSVQQLHQVHETRGWMRNGCMVLAARFGEASVSRVFGVADLENAARLLADVLVRNMIPYSRMRFAEPFEWSQGVALPQ